MFLAKIHHQISVYVLMIVDFKRALDTIKVLDASRRSRTLSGGAAS